MSHSEIYQVDPIRSGVRCGRRISQDPQIMPGMDRRKEHSEVRKKKVKAFLVSDHSGSIIFQYDLFIYLFI